MLAGLDLLDWYASCFSSSVFIFTFIRERLSGFLLWIDGLVKRFVSLPGELERDGLRLFEIFTGELFHRDFVCTWDN